MATNCFCENSSVNNKYKLYNDFKSKWRLDLLKDREFFCLYINALEIQS